MKIAALQMVSTPDWARNRDAAAALIERAAKAGAQMLLLPEYFCLMGRRDSDKLALAEAAGKGPIQQFLAQKAREHRVWLVGGTLPIAPEPDAPLETDAGGTAPRVLNRCCVFDPDGQGVTHYDKIHLFGFDNGSERYDEGRTLMAGTRPVAFDIPPRDERGDAVRVGLSICYDLRFPELYRALMQPPCDLLCVPAAFTYTTGRAHWELLLRARAIENQCYVLASAQGGSHENGRRTWGHSMLIDPWGEVLDVCAEGEGLVIGELSKQRLAEVRRQLPALQHRVLAAS